MDILQEIAKKHRLSPRIPGARGIQLACVYDYRFAAVFVPLVCDYARTET